jgi:4-amino-4-deoxy-L-arabinose transferase-like glycosyltransferase
MTEHKIFNRLMLSGRNIDRTQKLLVAITILALAIRVVYVLLAPQVDPILQRDPLYGDASGYHLLAINLMKGWGLTWDGEQPTSFRMPGYPLFLALIYSLTQPTPYSVRLVQGVLGALTCIPVFTIARRLGGESVAILAGLGVALHPLLIYMTGWLYSETLFFLLLWLSLLILIQMLEQNSLIHATFAGLILGFSTLIRPEVAVIPIFFLAAGWLLRWSRQLLGLMLIVQITLIVIIAPWMIRNTSVHQQFVPLTTNSGVNLYGGNNDRATGGSFRDVPFMVPGFSEVDSNQELTRRGVEWIKNHPQKFISLLPAKLYKFLSPVEMENTEKSPLGKWALPVNLVYAVFLLIAAWGAIINREAKITHLLVMLLGWYALMALVFYGGTRIALPATPGLIILAAVGLIDLWGKRSILHSIRKHRILAKQ